MVFDVYMSCITLPRQCWLLAMLSFLSITVEIYTLFFFLVLQRQLVHVASYADTWVNLRLPLAVWRLSPAAQRNAIV